MRPNEFGLVVKDFSSEFGPMEDDRPARIGRWLIRLLGIGPVCVAIGYRDGHFARRFVLRTDTRSVNVAMEWEKRYRRAWLKVNLEEVDADLASDYLALAQQAEGITHREEESMWRSVMATYKWEQVGHWGPGTPVVDDRLEHLQLLFMVTRLVELTRGPHASFAHLMGSDPLAGGAPVLAIGLGGRQDAEMILTRAYAHVIEMGAPGGFAPVDEVQRR